MTDDSQSYTMAYLAQMIGAKIIVEAGTYMGAATNILARVNPEATVYTADPHTSPNLTESNIVFYRGDFLEMLGEIQDPVDFGYVDATPLDEFGTERTYNYRWLCGLAIQEKLSPGGLICFDDTDPAPWRMPFIELGYIKNMCQINLTALKGFSIYSHTVPHT